MTEAEWTAFLRRPEIAAFNPNSGPGDPYGGSHDVSQSYLFRPLPGQPSHRTAVPNVHMLGAATWPGHGINGGSGYIVAQELLGTHTHAEKMAGAADKLSEWIRSTGRGGGDKEP